MHVLKIRRFRLLLCLFGERETGRFGFSAQCAGVVRKSGIDVAAEV